MNRIMTLFAALALSCVMGASVSAQSGYEVKGVVVDQLGPVIGATVLEQGTTNGAATGLDGDYVLTVSSADAMVEISCIGYASQTFKASQVPAKVTLSEDAMFLEDVVVIGYGSQKKKEVTGSVASVKAEDFNPGVKTSPMGLLQGKVAGLNIINTSADPTVDAFTIQIRGTSTLEKGANNSPLYIVDGIPVDNIHNIAPDEIASMDVLKDGSAAAIYGTRGTNGVIIITTKRGDNFSDVANTRVEYSGYASVSVRNNSTGMATPEEYHNLTSLTGGKVAPVIYYDKNGKTYHTDWMDAVTRDAAYAHNHNVAIVGSSSKFNYRASVNYKDAQGIAKKNDREEFIAKLAASQKALDGWLDLQYDFSYMHYRNERNCTNWALVGTMNPTYPIYDPTTENGFFYIEGVGEENPVEHMDQKEYYGDGNFFRGSVRATVNIKPVQGLKVSGFAAIEEGDNREYWYNNVLLKAPDQSNKAGRNNNSQYNRLFEVTADYVRTFGKHNVSAVAGFSYQNRMYDYANMENKGFPTSGMKYYMIQNGDASKDYLKVESGRNSNTLAAFFARANYNYADKYLASVSVRREGSSRFGANRKWGWFPAVSLGWRIAGEDFMADKTWVNDLKLRAGFGVTGNNLGSDLKSVALLQKGGEFWYNGDYEHTYTVTQNINPNLGWEKKYEYNLGLDYAFLDNRIYGSLDVYYRFTDDLLWEYEVPTPPNQFPTLLANAGQMESYGIELSLSGVPVKTKDWTWVTTPTISFNRNYVVKLSDPEQGFNYDKTESGHISGNGVMNTTTQLIQEKYPAGTFYGYKFYDFNSQGTWYFLNKNDKPVSVVSEDDRRNLGNAQPWMTFGWNNTVRYKNLDVSIFFRGVVGNKILNVNRWIYGPQNTSSFNYFMGDMTGEDVIYANKSLFSDYYLEDGSYIKLDNLTVGYTFKFKQNKFVDNLRVYFTGQNLLTITSYSGPDPEVNTTSVWGGGIDKDNFYPKVATFLIGVNLGLF